MQQFHCRCGQVVYCENSLCSNCGRTLAFEPMTGQMLSLDLQADGVLTDADGTTYRLCANWAAHRACNGIVEASLDNSSDSLCRCCRLNRTIPIIEGREENLLRWKRLERAKRRMIAGVSKLGLSVETGSHGPMRFDFLEDKRSHPDVLEHFVTTGHKDGVITINVTEADEIQRVQQRELMGERYRTVLGHFRHEAGHFFYGDVVRDLDTFTQLFGDPNLDYTTALETYYANGPQRLRQLSPTGRLGRVFRPLPAHPRHPGERGRAGLDRGPRTGVGAPVRGLGKICSAIERGQPRTGLEGPLPLCAYAVDYRQAVLCGYRYPVRSPTGLARAGLPR